ncbi:RNA polymerase, sigma 28 subunit, Sig B/F/G subfamily [Ammonifex degensii KC4]|uniref:RNA polymerase sigma factor n=1 Tax=Ammonifex degensii (strain DSM 10501 / KC4) TaxID=429009 RepID=C9RCM6_AMMDK|nr:SigB/SigF/SigG family RNA polymerase sigma factor [Ammonifex degensii]ACX52003.1 RNA polymerase, sigma 28 subunit, Sig B/F/G subfamily [Ammonifex degensii KC4]
MPGKDLLDQKTTRALLLRAQEGDPQARELLVRANLGLVGKVVRRFAGQGREGEDLFQIGCIGLLKAIDRFDPQRGTCFSTYAVATILGEIRRFLRDDGMLKVSRSLKETSRRVIRTRASLKMALGREPSVAEIAESLGIAVEEVVMALEAGKAPAFLQEPLAGEGEEALCWEDCLSSEKEESWLETLSLRESLRRLPAREREIIWWRFFAGYTQEEVAKQLGISQAQVSRLERNALQKLREELEA